MATSLQIYRNLATPDAPDALNDGEMGYTLDGNTLYIGGLAIDGVTVLSSGTTVKIDSDDSSKIDFKASDNTNTVTLKVPPTLSDNIELKFPATIEEDKLLAGDSTGQLSFQDKTVSDINKIQDVSTDTPSNKSVLKWNGNEWVYITAEEFKSLLGLVDGDAIYNNMIVNGNLIVGGSTEFGTADTVIKDKTLALGVSGGVLEGTVTSVDGGNLTIEGTNGINGTQAGHLLWVDGENITSDVYEVGSVNVNSNTITFANYSGGGSPGDFVLFSASVVSDTTINQSGFTLLGDTEKTFQWKQGSNDDNNYFELDGGSLVVDGHKLFIEGIEVINTQTNILHPNIEIDADQLEGNVLDGEEFPE